MKNDKWFEMELKDARNRLTYLTEEFVVHFINQVYVMMEKKGILQADLSNLLNKKPSYISRILNAPHNITAKTMVHLAMALRCEIDALKLIEKDAQLYDIPVFASNKSTLGPKDYCLRGDENDNASAKAA